MFFKSYLLSVADCLQARFEGMQRKGQNPADKGELCEVFIKEFLTDFLSGQLRIFRGGKIVNIDNDNNGSKQLDIVVTTRSSLKIFGDKGIYPIETVVGVFSITATLSRTKLDTCIEEFQSIPKKNPQFNFFPIDSKKGVDHWYTHFPFKCVFAFAGDINQNWETELNGMAKEGDTVKDSLPDLIIINKKGMIGKVTPGVSKYLTGEVVLDKDFHFMDFGLSDNFHFGFCHILNRLSILSHWQYFMTPKYYEYFNRDF